MAKLSIYYVDMKNIRHSGQNATSAIQQNMRNSQTQPPN